MKIVLHERKSHTMAGRRQAYGYPMDTRLPITLLFSQTAFSVVDVLSVELDAEFMIRSLHLGGQ
jgi:hypothetical protein